MLLQVLLLPGGWAVNNMFKFLKELFVGKPEVAVQTEEEPVKPVQGKKFDAKKHREYIKALERERDASKK